MKFGMKRMLGLGFLATLAGMATTSKQTAKTETAGDIGKPGIIYGSPIYNGKSQRNAKINKLRCSHNAKLKRRRVA